MCDGLSINKIKYSLKYKLTLVIINRANLFQVALAPALLCWVPLSLLLSSVPPFSPPPVGVFAWERSVRLEDEPVPNLSLLWRLLESQQEERENACKHQLSFLTCTGKDDVKSLICKSHLNELISFPQILLEKWEIDATIYT